MTAPSTPPVPVVDGLAQEIRRVDGNHDLGAGALAEALLPFITRLSASPDAGGGEGLAVRSAMARIADINFAVDPSEPLDEDIEDERGYRLIGPALDEIEKVILAALSAASTHVGASTTAGEGHE